MKADAIDPGACLLAAVEIHVGLTTEQIAGRLSISAKTADHHIQHIYRKIGVSTRAAAALWATQHAAVP